MNESTTVLTEIDPAGYAVLTLNRPEARNALSRELMRSLVERVNALEADPAVRVLIVTGAGAAFCAGLDLKEIGSGKAGFGGTESEDGESARRDNPVLALERFSGPVIGAINGPSATGGFELALACDLLIASPNARFADTHARVGVMPGWGLSQKLSRAIGAYRAREVSFTGNWVSAEQAQAWGFVNRVVPAEDLLPTARRLAIDMLGALPKMLEQYKAVINEGLGLPLAEGLALERRLARAHNRNVKSDEVESRREAVRARNRQGGSETGSQAGSESGGPA
jgi:enoyl-CoA hydratase